MLRPKFEAHVALLISALCLAYICAAAVPPASAGASSPATPRAHSADTQGTDPTATAARVGVSDRRLNVSAGSRAVVTGSVRPGGMTVALQVKRRGRWVTLDRDRADARGRYVLRDRVRGPMSVLARVHVLGAASGGRSLGRLNVYRRALASWYGPGLFGRKTGCGGTLGHSQLGVAHKSLACGTRVTLRHRGRTVRVGVIDRGPYAGGREFDLTAATARRLHFRGHGSIQTTR